MSEFYRPKAKKKGILRIEKDSDLTKADNLLDPK